MERRSAIGAAIVGAMIVTSFFGVAAADAEWSRARVYWTAITVLFGLGTFALVRMHRRDGLDVSATLLRLAAHWLGVLVAVQIKFFLVSNNQITEGEAGLSLSVILALGTFLCGVYLDWRLVAVGAALAVVAPASALVQENVLIIIGVGLAAFAVVLAGDALRRRWRGSVDPDART
jgi:hypothetical protein